MENLCYLESANLNNELIEDSIEVKGIIENRR